MKFDFIIGNPPYQEETETQSATNGQKPRKNIFHHFQMQADIISKEGTVLIYPGGRWIHQSGKGLQQFGFEQINHKKLEKVIFYPNAKEVFSTTDIPDGISIVIKRKSKKTSGFVYSYVNKNCEESFRVDNPGDELMPFDPKDLQILKKVDNFVKNNNLKYLHDAVLPRSLFAIESDFVEKNPEIVREYVEGEKIDCNREIKIFTNDKAGAAGRSKWFVTDRNIIKQNQKYISEWQVVVSSAHAGGQEGRDNQISIIDNESAFGRARVALRSFKSLKEAVNFKNYVNSKIIRYTFLMTDEALTSLAKRVPDLIDYNDKNGIIDFSLELDIDKQLASIIGFTEEELQYIYKKAAE